MGDEESLSGATATNTPSDPQTNDSQAAASTASGEFTIGGYHEIASMMARWPVTAIFKRFGFLNYLNILYLQAELEMLEKGLLDKAQEDKASPDKWRRNISKPLTTCLKVLQSPTKRKSVSGSLSFAYEIS